MERLLMRNQEELLLAQRDRTIQKANELIQHSRFSLSLNQQKIILYLISQINGYDENFRLFNFSIQEFCKVAGLKLSGRTYNEIKDLIKDIRDKSIWLDTGDGKEILLSWIDRAIIYQNSGTIQLRISEDMRPYLLQLKKNYTSYELIYTLAMKSKYSIRLFEWCKSVHYNETKEYQKEVSVEQLKRLLDCDSYKLYGDFKRRALNVAVSEINTFTDKILSYTEKKHGNKVVAINFTIGTKDALARLEVKESINEALGPIQLSFWDIVEE